MKSNTYQTTSGDTIIITQTISGFGYIILHGQSITTSKYGYPYQTEHQALYFATQYRGMVK